MEFNTKSLLVIVFNLSNAWIAHLLAGGHYSELIQLYKSNRNHRAALLLLNRLAEHPDSFPVPPKNPEQFGPKAIVDYLKV